MKTKINNHVIPILISLTSAILLFHVAILFKIIPYTIAWGGNLQNDSEMYVFETFSILINLLLIFVVLMKAGKLSFRWKEIYLNGILWVYVGLFVLNTVGNLFAISNVEKSFAILTFIFALLCWKIATTKYIYENTSDK